MFQQNKSELEFYKFGFFAHNFFYTPVKQVSQVKYEGEFIVKDWFLKTEYGKSCLAYVPKRTFLDRGEKLLERLLQDEPKFTKDLYKICEEVLDLETFLEGYSYEVCKFDLPVKLEDFYYKYEETYSRALAFGYVLDFALEDYLKQNSIDLPQPRYFSYDKLEENQLRALPKEDSLGLQEHYYKYFWLKADYSGGHEPDLNFFKEGMARVIPTDTPLVLVNPDIQMPKNISEWIELLTYIRDVRKKCNLMACTLLDRFLKQDSRQKGLTYETCSMLFIDEYLAFKGSQLKVSNPRIIHITNSGLKDLTKADWSNLFPEKQALDKKIKGVVANKGLVKGRVRVVIEKEDFTDFKEGEILVTHMTRPNFISLMKLSSGIITDEGGITCHAAIVSRELGKPCLIGTQKATQILKSGDLVELDAINGVVNIINQ